MAGYRAVMLSLKRAGQAPGDVTDRQIANVADSLVCVGTAILVWVIIRDEKTADASNPV